MDTSDDDGDDGDAVSRFLALTGTEDEDAARRCLEMSGGDNLDYLDAAVGLFLELNGDAALTAAAPPADDGSGSSSDISSRSGHDTESFDDIAEPLSAEIVGGDVVEGFVLNATPVVDDTDRSAATSRPGLVKRLLKATGISSKKKSAFTHNEPPAETTPLVFVYTGQSESEIPREVTQVLVDPSVKSIRSKTFKKCYQLIEVVLCEGLEYIGPHAFSDCSSLKSVKVSSAVYAQNPHEDPAPLPFKDSAIIGASAFKNCTSLECVEVPFAVKSIGRDAFNNCSQLKEIHLNEGLVQIGGCSFHTCTSLAIVKFPAALKLIGESAFRNCEKLADVQFSLDTTATGAPRLEHIGNSAFRGCKSLRRVTISAKLIDMESFSDCEQLMEVNTCSGLRHIKHRAFGNCDQLIAVKLRDGVKIDKSAFQNCSSLRNVGISSCSFEGCHDIISLFGSQSDMNSALADSALVCNALGKRDEIESRFSSLPVHKLCYHHSGCNTDEIAEQIKKAIVIESVDKTLGMTEGLHPFTRDCLGMTPLHVLTCSTTHSLNLYKLLVAHHPQSLVLHDRWGCPPLLYAIWGNASEEVIRLFVEKQKSAFSDVAQNWDVMLETLCRAGAPLETIWRLLQTYLEVTEDSAVVHPVNWQKFARELAIHCFVRCTQPHHLRDFSSNWNGVMEMFGTELQQSPPELVKRLVSVQQFVFDNRWQVVCYELVKPLSGWWQRHDPDSSLEMFRFLAKCRIAERLDNLRVRKWQTVIVNSFQKIPTRGGTVTLPVLLHVFDAIHSKLVTMEAFVDAVNILELALWKAKIKEVLSPKLDDCEADIPHGYCVPDVRQQCRITCGAEIIIRGVMPFLIDVKLIEQ